MRYRSLSTLSVLLLSLGLVACEQNEAPATTTPPPEAAAPMPPPIPVRTGRSVATPAARPAAAAPAPGRISAAELRGDRVAEVNQMLTSRGYQRMRSQGGTTYWRNTQTNRCLRVVAANGRVTTVSNADAARCRR